MDDITPEELGAVTGHWNAIFDNIACMTEADTNWARNLLDKYLPGIIALYNAGYLGEINGNNSALLSALSSIFFVGLYVGQHENIAGVELDKDIWGSALDGDGI